MVTELSQVKNTPFTSENEEHHAHWDATAERRVRTKIDLSVLLLLFLGMTVFQLDRMNLASALTGGFAADIKVDQNTINLGNQLMFLGIIVLEIPSNMLLQRVGPRSWIPAQIFLFGFIACLQVFVRNRAGFLASRMILGICEAGYIPGSIYTLSTWYAPSELAKRVAILFFGMFGGNAVSPLLGAGILRLDGQGGLKGWQWIFLIEGLWTVAVAILLLLVLPGSPADPAPLVMRGWVRFEGEEREILTARVQQQQQQQNHTDSDHIPLSIVRTTLLNPRRWLHFVSTACVFATWSPLTTYTPSIIMSLGFNRVEANALGAIGAGLTLPIVFLFAWISDRTRQRGATVIAAISCYLAVLIAARGVLPSVEGRWRRFGLWTVVNAFAVCYHPVHNTWVQVNCTSQAERSISIAMWVMSAIAGLMAGTQIFRADDAPRYHRGLVIMIALVASGLVLAILQETVYFVLNTRRRKSNGKTVYVL